MLRHKLIGRPPHESTGDPRAAGKLLIEVFEPELPVTARSFLTRCNPGAANTFKGTRVDQVVENYALFGGCSRG